MMHHRNQQDLVVVRPANRPRLSAMLDSAVKNGLVILSAGSGTGKTFAVDAFAAQAKEPVVWVRITRSDARAERFWPLLAKAVAAWDQELSQAMMHHVFPETLSGIHHFLHQLSQAVERSGKAIMVFDDVQLIQEGPVLSLLTNMLQHCGEQLSFILIMGEEQNLNLPEDLQVSLLTDRHLQFTREEIREYFTGLGIVLDDAGLGTVVELTEGMAIAVYMLGMHLRRGEPLGRQNIDNAMATLFEMFDKELFQPMGQEYTRAMVLLSYLDDFTPESVEELVGLRSEDLVHLIKSNPLIQYSPGSTTYCFHNLFRKFLMTKQALLSKKIRHAFLRKAARWFEQRDRLVEALGYYLICKDYGQMQAALDDTQVLRLKIDTARKVEELLEQVPEEYYREHPMMCFYLALTCYTAGHSPKAARYVKRLQAQLAPGLFTAEATRASGELHIYLGFWGLRRGSYEFAGHFRSAAALLPQGSTVFRGGRNYLGSGSSLPFGEEGTENILQMQEALLQSAPYLEKLFGHWGRGSEFTATAEVHYYRGELDRSVYYAGEAIATAVEHSQWDVACNACYILLRTSIARGLLPEAEYHLDLLHQYAARTPKDRYFVLPDISEFMIYYYVGITERSAPWIRDERQLVLEHILPSAGRGLYVKAVYLVVQHQYYQALTFIDNAIGICLGTGQWFSRINLITLKAYVYDCLGQYSIAAKHIQEICKASQKNGIVIPFAEYGANMQTMIKHLRELPPNSHTIPDDWLDNIYQEAEKFRKNAEHFRAEYLRRHPQEFSFKQRLSKWEYEVLLLLCRGLSNEEIARQLSSPVGDIKDGLGELYRKIGAASRPDAVRVALADETIARQVKLLGGHEP